MSEKQENTVARADHFALLAPVHIPYTAKALTDLDISQQLRLAFKQSGRLGRDKVIQVAITP
jgi:hypothetical protein